MMLCIYTSYIETSNQHVQCLESKAGGMTPQCLMVRTRGSRKKQQACSFSHSYLDDYEKYIPALHGLVLNTGTV